MHSPAASNGGATESRAGPPFLVQQLHQGGYGYMDQAEWPTDPPITTQLEKSNIQRAGQSAGARNAQRRLQPFETASASTRNNP